MSSNYPGPYDQYANTSWDKAQQPRGLDTPVQEILKFQQRQLQHVFFLFFFHKKTAAHERTKILYLTAMLSLIPREFFKDTNFPKKNENDRERA